MVRTHNYNITGMPGRAACGKEELLFLWERANFAPFQCRNYDSNQYQIRMIFKSVSPHVGEM